MHLENNIKNDFLAPDEECAFLGQAFLIAKIELRACCEGMLLFLCADPRQREHARSAFMLNVLRSLYLFNELHSFIKEKISSSPPTH